MDKDKQLVKLLKKFGVKKLRDTNQHVMRLDFRSATSNHRYIISKRVTAVKRWECSCPGWVFKRHCKHIDIMSPILDKIKTLTMERKPKLLEYRKSNNAKKKKPKR